MSRAISFPSARAATNYVSMRPPVTRRGATAALVEMIVMKKLLKSFLYHLLLRQMPPILLSYFRTVNYFHFIKVSALINE